MSVGSTRTGMCPSCRVARNLVVAVSHEQTAREDGTAVITEISTAHCETCRTFVSRDVRELSDDEAVVVVAEQITFASQPEPES